MKTRLLILALLPWIVAGYTGTEKGSGRHFIAHRGATMRCTLSGENSREAIRFAARAGFDCIETDVRYTCDSVLVAVHDANLARTFTYNDGRPVPGEIAVSDVSHAQLRDNFVLKATRPEYRTRALTLEEFCTECHRCGLRIFIEPKKVTPDWVCREMIAIADRVFGRGGYVITSNNDANDHIRFEMGITDIPLMGILYQSSYEHISSLGGVVMAISTTRFEKEDYFANVLRAKADGLETESHADDFEHFDMVNSAGIDYVSTDLLAPDYRGQGETLYLSKGGDAAKIASESAAAAKKIEFGAIYLDMKWYGSATVTLSSQTFVLPEAKSLRHARHQLMVFDAVPAFEITAPSEDFRIKDISLRIVRF
ncbi:hypothetical protein FACS1894159_11830 [Bacteroidia bacterium]|nr:hypothetical protein FACS1894159_11830 [Bacteroidia bacterium]